MHGEYTIHCGQGIGERVTRWQPSKGLVMVGNIRAIRCLMYRPLRHAVNSMGLLRKLAGTRLSLEPIY